MTNVLKQDVTSGHPYLIFEIGFKSFGEYVEVIEEEDKDGEIKDLKAKL